MESTIFTPPPVEPSTGRKAKSSRWQPSDKSHRMDHTIVVQQGATLCHLEVAYSVCHLAAIPIYYLSAQNIKILKPRKCLRSVMSEIF